VGAGLLVVAAACGDDAPLTVSSGGVPVAPYQECPSDPPVHDDDCTGWRFCDYKTKHYCLSGAPYYIEMEFECRLGKVVTEKQTQSNCPNVPLSVLDDCPQQEPAEGEACDVQSPVCSYETLVRCPDGQAETVVAEYACSEGVWGMPYEIGPECN